MAIGYRLSRRSVHGVDGYVEPRLEATLRARSSVRPPGVKHKAWTHDSCPSRAYRQHRQITTRRALAIAIRPEARTTCSITGSPKRLAVGRDSCGQAGALLRRPPRSVTL